MQKKKYSIPTVETVEISCHPVMGDASVTGVNGTAGLKRGDDNNVPTEAGSRRGFSWDDED